MALGITKGNLYTNEVDHQGDFHSGPHVQALPMGMESSSQLWSKKDNLYSPLNLRRLVNLNVTINILF